MAESSKPTIGKTVLETLTSGMYDDARFIFREYVQNAADQIDVAVETGVLNKKSDGRIEIIIHADSKKISVYDNATGVPSKNVLQFLGDVANSQKDSDKRRGFRGIGRLGGLGYCDKLIFETSYRGESVSNKMVIDANLLRRIIENRNDKSDAAAALSVVTVEDPPKKEDEEAHYFRVTLENVSNDKLLDEKYVKDYLSMVAPVPFSESFEFTRDIKTYFKSRSLILDEYNIEVNRDVIYKTYKNIYVVNDKGKEKESNVIGVDFVDIIDEDDTVLAVCWYGFRDLSNVVLKETDFERGIRIRSKNITIGDGTTCDRFFNVEKTNSRFIGEIHTVGSGFVPNARRDYFTENAICKLFEEKAKGIFKDANLENRLAQTASKLHNSLKKIEEYKKASESFKLQKGRFESEAEESYYLKQIKELEEKAVKAKREIDRIEKKANDSKSTSARKLYDSIIGAKDVSVEELTRAEQQVSKYAPPTFSKLSKDQEQVVLEIFEILEDELDFDLSELIKKKIVDRYN